MARTLGNPQDEFALLCEDIRLGRTLRPVAREGNKNTVWQQAKINGFDLSEVPVFFTRDYQLFKDSADEDTMTAALHEIEQGEFRLPFPTCALMWRVSAESVKVSDKNPNMWHDRYNVSYLQQENDVITMHQFTRHAWKVMGDRWAMQATSATIYPKNGEIVVEVGTDPKANFDPDFQATLEQAATQRLALMLCQMYLILHRSGTVTFVTPGPESIRITERRKRLGLPEIGRVRVIQLDPPDRVVTLRQSAATPEATLTKAAHYRRGHYRTLRNGNQVWVRASAIHGGLGAKPPWFELR